MNSSRFLISLLAALLVIAVTAAPALCEDVPSEVVKEAATPEVGSIEEFNLVHADTMTLTRQADKPQVFEGAVDIVLIDKAGEQTGIKAERIEIHYKQDLKKIDRIEAKGGVRISRLGTTASTELAIYRSEKNVIELLIDPRVEDSRGELTADKITVDLDTDDVIAQGNVKGVVYTQAFQETSEK
jgi:lipopolysaccharide export system protein LptA